MTCGLCDGPSLPSSTVPNSSSDDNSTPSYSRKEVEVDQTSDKFPYTDIIFDVRREPNFASTTINEGTEMNNRSVCYIDTDDSDIDIDSSSCESGAESDYNPVDMSEEELSDIEADNEPLSHGDFKEGMKFITFFRHYSCF